MKNRDVIIFWSIYTVTLIFMIYYNFTHPVINDGVSEYRGFMLNVEEGWLYRYSLINTCLISIWFPALIQNITNIEPMIIYRLFPPLFYAVMPSFCYLIARRYLSTRYSIIASLVIIFSSYILFFPDVGRVGVSLGILAGLVWALLDKRLLTSIMFGCLIVFAHYGAAIIAFGIVTTILLGRLLWDREYIKVTSVTYVVIIVFTLLWHFGIAHYSGDSMLNTLLRPDEARGVLSEFNELYIPEFAFDKLESRDQVTQAAFGLNFMDNPLPLKVEILANWMIVGFMSLGLLLIFRDKTIDRVFKLLLATMYGLIIVTVLIPPLSVFYGTQRVYFTSSIVLATCFGYSIKWLSEKINRNGWLIGGFALGFYAICTSGLIYSPFGLTKSIPIFLRLAE